MTTTTSPHEEFEIAALRRARGALDADGVARLEAHLATCAACRGFSSMDAATKTAMRRRAREAVALRNWEKCRAVVRSRQQRVRKLFLWYVAIITVLVAIAGWRIGATSALIVGVACILTSATMALAWFIPFRRRATKAESDGPVELLRFCRFELDSKINAIHGNARIRWVMLPFYLFMLAACISRSLRDDSLARPNGSWLYAFQPLFLWTGYLFTLWYKALVLLPRLERERRELDS